MVNPGKYLCRPNLRILLDPHLKVQPVLLVHTLLQIHVNPAPMVLNFLMQEQLRACLVWILSILQAYLLVKLIQEKQHLVNLDMESPMTMLIIPTVRLSVQLEVEVSTSIILLPVYLVRQDTTMTN